MPHKDPDARKAYNKKRYADHREEELAKAKKWRDEHPGYYKARYQENIEQNRKSARERQKKKWDEDHEQARKDQREYRATVPEKVVKWKHDDYKKHKEQHAIRGKKYRLNNKERVNKKSREWAQKNPEKRREIKRRSRLKHPEQDRQQRANRRTRKLAAPGKHTNAQWQAKKVEYGNRCFYCGSAEELERDHIIPLVRGGSNDLANIIPACNRCNREKNKMTMNEFLAYRHGKLKSSTQADLFTDLPAAGD